MTDSAQPAASSLYTMLHRVVRWGFRGAAQMRKRGPHARVACTIPPPSETPLIVMLHGYEGSPNEFAVLAQHLQAKVGERCDIVILDCLDPAMGATPDEVAGQLDAFLRTHGLKERPLYLIGHSMGGLVARRYAHWEDGPPDVRAVVLLGTPNGGLHAWNLLPIHWTRSQGFDARFNDRFPPQPSVRYLVVAGHAGANLLEGYPNDRVVGAWSVTRLADLAGTDVHLETRIYPLDHWELRNSPEVATEIARFLGI